VSAKREPEPRPKDIELPIGTGWAWRVRYYATDLRVWVRVEICHIKGIGPARVTYSEGCVGGSHRHAPRCSGWFLYKSDADAFAVELTGYVVRRLRDQIDRMLIRAKGCAK